MVRTLVTIGYHTSEVDWGRDVREQYKVRGLKGDRDIKFYEITDSDVETGNPSRKNLSTVLQIMESESYGLWIDIHCGYDRMRYGNVDLGYTGFNDDILSSLKEIDNIIVQDEKIRPQKFQSRLQHGFADVFFPYIELKRKGEMYQKAMDRTLRFINQVYDAHL